MTVATEQSIGLCPMGLIRGDRLAGRLDLPATDEILHSLIVGLPADRELAEAPAEAVVSAGAGANGGGVALNGVVTSTEIRAFIGERLPRYMLPTSYAFVDEFPLNANGKIDRTALRERAGRRVVPDAVPATDFTPTEKTLCDIAGDVFAIEAVDVDAAFFDLGANSVQLAQLSAVVESRIGRTISVVDAFRYPTIRKLAAFIDSSEPAVCGATAERARIRSALRREHRRAADDDGAHA
jgi:acyl carrier protein